MPIALSLLLDGSGGFFGGGKDVEYPVQPRKIKDLHDVGGYAGKSNVAFADAHPFVESDERAKARAVHERHLSQVDDEILAALPEQIIGQDLKTLGGLTMEVTLGRDYDRLSLFFD